MKLNIKKTKNMIFKFTKKYQFTTKLSVNSEQIEMVNQTKLLGKKHIRNCDKFLAENAAAL